VFDRKARSLLQLKINEEAMEAFDAALCAVQESNMKQNKQDAFVKGNVNCLAPITARQHCITN
jgi:hypothetical protein